MYVPFKREMSSSYNCGCATSYKRELTCVDKNGTVQNITFVVYMSVLICLTFLGCYHSVSVTFCTCESEVETLMRCHLFPATPKQPQLAFTFDLLDWLEALMLECQVSAQDFVAAIGILSDAKLMTVLNVVM